MSLLLALLGPTSSQLVGTPLLTSTNYFPEQVVQPEAATPPYTFEGYGIGTVVANSTTVTYSTGETVFVVLYNQSAGRPTGCSDGTNTYTLVGNNTVGNYSIGVFKADNVVGGTYTLGSSTNISAINYYRYRNIKTGAAQAVITGEITNPGATFTNNVVLPTITPTQSPAMVFIAGGDQNAGGLYVGAEFIGRDGGNIVAVAGDNRVTTTNTITPHFTGSGFEWTDYVVAIFSEALIVSDWLYPSTIQSTNAFFAPTLTTTGNYTVTLPVLSNTNVAYKPVVTGSGATNNNELVGTPPLVNTNGFFQQIVQNESVTTPYTFTGSGVATGNTNSVTATYDAGETVFVIFGSDGTTTSAGGCSDGTNTYSLVLYNPGTGGRGSTAIYKADNVSAGTFTVTGTIIPTPGAYTGISYLRYRGLNSGTVQSAVTSLGSGLGSNGPDIISGTPVTVTTVPAMVLAYIGKAGGSTSTYGGTGYNQRQLISSSGGTLEDLRVTTPGTYTPTFGASNDSGALLITIAVKESAVASLWCYPRPIESTNAFFEPTVGAAGGTQTLTPGLYSNSNSYYSPTISVTGGGTQTLTPSLYSNSVSYYAPTISVGSVTLTPGLYSSTTTYYNSTITVGGVTLQDPLYTNTNSFFAATISVGAVTLTPNLYSNTTTYYTPTITTGVVTITPSLYSNSSTLYAGSVSIGAATISPTLYSNSNTLYNATITVGGVTLLDPLYTNTSTYYSPTITTGVVSVTPGLYSNSTTFYTPTITVTGVNQTLTAALLTNSNTSYIPTIIVGTTLVTESWAGSGTVDGKTPTTGGGTWQIDSGGSGVSYSSGTATPDGDYASAYHSATYQNAQFSTVVYPADIIGSPLPCSIIGRATTLSSGTTCYLAEFDSINSTVKLKKFIAGTPTDLATVSINPSGASASLVISGSILKVILNGSEIISVSDTSITAAGYWGFAVRFGGVGEDLANSSIGPVSIKSAAIAVPVSLLAGLYTNTSAYYNSTVTTGGVTLLDPLYTNTNSFFTPSIIKGIVTLTPSLYSNSVTLYNPTTAVSAVTLTPSLYSNSNTLYNATINVGVVTLAPGLYSNSNTMYSPTIAVGAVTLIPGLYSNSNILYPPSSSLLQLLTAPLLTNTNSYYNPTATVGVAIVDLALYSNNNTFYSPTIAVGALTVSTPLLTNTSTVLVPTVVPGTITLAPPVLASSNVYYLPTITKGPVTVDAALFNNSTTYYTPTIIPGAVNVQLPTIASNSVTYAPQVYGIVTGIVAGNIVVDVPSANTVTTTEGVNFIPTLVVNNVVTFVETPHCLINVNQESVVSYSDSVEYILDNSSKSIYK